MLAWVVLGKTHHRDSISLAEAYELLNRVWPQEALRRAEMEIVAALDCDVLGASPADCLEFSLHDLGLWAPVYAPLAALAQGVLLRYTSPGAWPSRRR